MIDIPTVGTLTLSLALLCAGYTFAVSLAAAGGRSKLLPAARFSTFATIALVATAVFLLAYAFQAHDFRIRYVARYSDRSMSPIYLWTSLWGGQDGSLLWWTFLVSLYTGAFTAWIRNRYQELQPYLFATLSSILGFFLILMLFAANPFATGYGSVPADGEGLNPLLQNYWMVIHPPSLYLGMTGWSVPFAFVVAALLSGRLDDEWIVAARRWVLVAWAFLSLGNMLGMFWSYEELGWGGYWAWDPVENASFLPWLTGTAYLHSVMVQERRGMLKVWNVSLLLSTFVLTIFGTFLTRSGLIASVHSFARSDIGIYFVWYMILLGISSLVMVAWRLPELRNGLRIGLSEYSVAGVLGLLGAGFLIGGDVSFGALAAIFAVPVAIVAACHAVETFRGRMEEATAAPPSRPGRIESIWSREFAFLLNNLVFVGMALFIIVATTYPLISEAIRGETVTVGPAYYNSWMIPLGGMLLFLTGVGPLLAWRKTTGKNLFRAFLAPTVTAIVVGGLHFFVGPMFQFSALIETDANYESWVGGVLATLNRAAPVVSTSLCAFVLATITQEYVRGIRVRRRLHRESVWTATVQLVSRARRRYGGYLVHAGVALMFLGWTGSAYDVENEASLMPGQTLEVGGYTFRYDRVRVDEDPNKRMLYTDLTVLAGGRSVGEVSPAKFVYRTHPQMPTTEVDIQTGPLHDLYVIMSAVDPATKRATFRVIKRPLVFWIWFGGAILLLGAFIAASPTLKEALGEARETSRGRWATGLALFAFGLVGPALLLPASSRAQSDELTEPDQREHVGHGHTMPRRSGDYHSSEQA